MSEPNIPQEGFPPEEQKPSEGESPKKEKQSFSADCYG